MNKTMIDNALNDISPEFMEEYAAFCAAEGSSPRARRFAPKRILAAAAAAAAVIAVSAFAVAQFAKTPSVPAPSEESNAAVSAFTIPDNAVLPPTRYGETTGHASLEKGYNLKTLYEDADVVALVRVGDWLMEYPEELTFSTKYDATLLKVYKGDEKVGTHIPLKQDGCSKHTYQGYPLFTYGDEMLLFMKIGVDPLGETVYWLPGSFLSVVDAAEIDGTYYFAERGSALSMSFQAATGKQYTPASKELTDSVIAAISERDETVGPILRKNAENYIYSSYKQPSFILSESEMTGLFEEFDNK